MHRIIKKIEKNSVFIIIDLDFTLITPMYTKSREAIALNRDNSRMNLLNMTIPWS